MLGTAGLQSRRHRAGSVLDHSRRDGTAVEKGAVAERRSKLRFGVEHQSDAGTVSGEGRLSRPAHNEGGYVGCGSSSRQTGGVDLGRRPRCHSVCGCIGNQIGSSGRHMSMSHGRRHTALLLLVVLALAACGTEELYPSGAAGDETGSSPPLDGAWVLVAASVDGQTLALNDQYRVTMTIDGSAIGGQAACNSYGGSVSIDDGAFAVDEISMTEMACEPSVMEIESTFLSGLARVSAATRSGDTASLTGEGVEFVFDLLPPVPTAELIGTTWVLDTIIQGDSATSTAAGAEPARLLLRADGTFVGGTGCRDLSGEYIVSGDTVQFTSFSTHGECPSEIEWQDGQVITVLEGGFTVEIDGDRLTVTASGGEGLSYRSG